MAPATPGQLEELSLPLSDKYSPPPGPVRRVSAQAPPTGDLGAGLPKGLRVLAPWPSSLLLTQTLRARLPAAALSPAML